MTLYESRSPKETFFLGETIGKKLVPSQVLLLEGDLGVGKTVFCKGIARGLGIEEPITSPTFVIVEEYTSGRLPLYHFDVYRIEDPEEMFEVGFEEYLNKDGICLIEWASNIRELIPEGAISVRIEKDAEQGFDYRRISLEGGGF